MLKEGHYNDKNQVDSSTKDNDSIDTTKNTEIVSAVSTSKTSSSLVHDTARNYPPSSATRKSILSAKQRRMINAPLKTNTSLRLFRLKHDILYSSRSTSSLAKFYKRLWIRPSYCPRSFLRRYKIRNLSVRKPDWTPPINYSTLNELSISYIFKSIQLRHDLLFDKHLRFRPNLDGPSGREKRRKAERYWRQVDDAFTTDPSFDFLRPIIQELSRILISFMQSLPWPKSITRSDIRDMLDTDLIIQQLKFNHLLGNQRVLWLKFIFKSLLKDTRQIDMMCAFFNTGHYTKALKQCFKILEIIKLNCANRVLLRYRNVLIGTCAEYEYQCFTKYNSKLTSIEDWFKITWKRIEKSNFSKNVFYAGLVYLIADDENTSSAFQLQTVTWPITLQFDKKRLTLQFRQEFQHIMAMSILLIPYRHLMGNHVSSDDIQSLKQVYSSLTKPHFHHQLAVHICKIAFQNDVSFWENWLLHNLQASSAIYKLMYNRLCQHLQFFTQYGYIMETSIKDMAPLESDVKALGMKIKMVADLNLQTYGSVYKNIMDKIIK